MRGNLYLLTVFSIVLIGGASIGCGPDDPDEREIIGSGDTGAMMDTSGADAGSDASPDADRNTDSGATDDAENSDAVGGDSGTSAADLCGAENVGVLTEDTTLTGSFGGDNVATTCGVTGGVDAIIRFELEEPARVQFAASSGATGSLNVQIHSGDCSDSERIVCYQSESEVFLADDGRSYYLVVEAGETTVASGDFEIDLTFEPLGCFPSGETECDGDDVLVCESDFQATSRSCAYACESGGCGADSCQNALEVSGGTQTFEGSLAGYTNNIDFAGRDECFEAGAVSTDGTELVFSLPGLETGQTVTVDASEELGDVNDNAIFVVSDCSAAPTCVTGGDQLFENLEWTVEDAGDYWVVIDLLSTQSDQFVYEITVE